MSEQQTRSNKRLDNFEANKQAGEQAAYENALYGEAGLTDFSDQAKSRVEEADAYERHLEFMNARPEAQNADLYADNNTQINPYMDDLHEAAAGINAEIDSQSAAAEAAEESRIVSLMNDSAHIRQMVALAANIANVGGTAVTAKNDSKLSAELNDRENRLQDLLIKFSDSSQLSPVDVDKITGRIIDSTETVNSGSDEVVEPEVEAVAEDQNTVEPVINGKHPEMNNKAETVTTVNIEDEVEAAKARLEAEADTRAQKVIKDMNETEQAKADRELLKPVSLEGLEPLAGPDDKIATISVDVLEPLAGPKTGEVDQAPVAEAGSSQPGSVSQRLRDRMSPTRSLHRAKNWNDLRSRERSGDRKAILGLGVAAVGLSVVGAYLANKYGLDFSSGSGGGNTPDASTVVDILDTDKTSDAAEINSISWNDFDPSARQVTPGEGWNSTFKQMGIPKSEWSDVLKDSGPKLQKLGEAYFDNNDLEWRIAKPGKLSAEALRVIAASSNKNGVEL